MAPTTQMRPRLARRGRLLLFSLYAFGVSAIEVCAYVLGGSFTSVASRLWLFSAAAFFVCSLAEIWSTFRSDLRDRFPWGCAAALVVAGVTFWKIHSFTYFINGEAAHQIYDGLHQWTETDFRYTGCAYFNYPSRQYLLAALPALLFGQNLLSLRLGYLWIFFPSILLFYCGLRATLRRNSSGGYLAAIGMLSVLTFPYVGFFLRGPEQVIMPLSLTLAATGWYLLSLVHPGPLTAFCLSWVGAMLATSYTPGLASWCLVVGLLLLTTAAGMREAKPADAAWPLLTAVIVVAFGLSSFVTRADIQLQLYQEGRGSLHDILTQIKGGYEVFFFSTSRWEDHTFVSPLWIVPLSVYLVTSLLLRNGAAHFLNSVWAIGAIAAAVYMQGYSIAGPAREIHRAMGVLPPLIAGSVITAGALLERLHFSLRKSAIALLVLLAVFVGRNVKHSHDVHHDPINRRLYEVLEWSIAMAREHSVLDAPFDMYIYSESTDFNLRDFVRYFFPGFRDLMLDVRLCLQNFSPTTTSMILYEGDACETRLREIMKVQDGFHELPAAHGLRGFLFIPPRGG